MMVPNYHNSSNSYASNSSSLVEKIEDQPYHIFNLTTHEASFSLCSRTIIRNSDQDQTPYHYREQLQLQDQEKVDESHSTIEKGDGARTTSIWKKEDGAKNQIEHGSSAKWMSSKMRMMRKMSTSSQQPSYKPMQQKLQDHKLLLSSSLETDNSSSSNNNSPYNNNNNNTIIRVCSDCNTTKTPLWRSGPKGPKSLCNACGIRQRKVRKALAAAAEAKTETNGAFKAVIKNNKVQHKEKGSSAESFLKPFKKRFKVKTPLSAGEENNKIDFEDLTMSLSQQYSALQQVFPQDEREGAILLMALSHGLVHG